MEQENTVEVIICDEEYPHLGEGCFLADGFEDAFLGLAQRFGFSHPVATYDYEKCLRVLEDRDGMSRQDAEEFFCYNVIGAWVGEQTPIFITGMTLDAVHAASTDFLDKEPWEVGPLTAEEEVLAQAVGCPLDEN